MEIGTAIAIVGGGLATLVSLGGAFAYLVRKADKVKHLHDKMPEFDLLEKRVEKLERNQGTVFEKLELRATETHSMKIEIQERFDEINAANSLIFKAISGIAQKVGADDVAALLDKETVITAKKKHY
jgi:predicted nuclease with TOPRIM domain